MESIPALFKEFSYRPRKSAGQNFLTDLKILDQIEQVVDCPLGDLLLEVGGGYGALTDRLARKGRPLTVVEPDHKLFAMLERKYLGKPDLTLVKADIMKLDLKLLTPPAPGLITVAGNIPYYLTTPLITRLLTQYHSVVRKIYLMVQKEVADRMTASPGTKAYGALTLCIQYYTRVQKKIDVPARCFRPKPKVDSAFLELEMKPSFPLEGQAESRFFALVRAIFQSRRKILLNSLKSMGQPVPQILAALEKSGLDPQIRGEKLNMEKLIELSKALESAQL
ncbi:MAG TPA: 16S rRNA (adenine(1518)-N(6)/adenine(1519)-N(6))-dimethyltransferase RsmA [bacterium]